MLVRAALTAFATLFLLDAGVSVTHSLSGWEALHIPRMVISLIAMLAGWMLFSTAVFFAPVPMRVILLPVAFLTWANVAGAFPFNLVPNHDIQLCLFQLAIGLWMIWRCCLTREGDPTPYLLGNPDADRPIFQWQRLAKAGALSICALPLLFAAALSNVFITQIADQTRGYVQVKLDGIYLEERRFARGDDEVHLVGMIHIGDRAYYESILSALAEKPEHTIILLEGVSDRNEILRKRPHYGGMANVMGLASQGDTDFMPRGDTNHTELVEADPDAFFRIRGVDALRADVDVAEFKPETIEFIEDMGRMFEPGSFVRFIRRVLFTKPRDTEAVFEDLLDLRNDHLITQIDRFLPSYDKLVVPWGAMHQKDIEDYLLREGFREVRRLPRRAIGFWRDTASDAKSVDTAANDR